MGQLRFLVARQADLSADVVERACVVSLEGVPWPCRCEWWDDQLVLSRNVSDSGYVHVPWRSEQFGELVLSTATLIERQRPYYLSVELARGTIHRVASQLGDWQLVGLRDTKAATAKLSEAKELLARAVTRQHLPAEVHPLASASIDAAIQAARLLVEEYTEQVITARRAETGRVPTWLAGNLENQPLSTEEAKMFAKAFNSAVVPFRWREIESTAGEFDWRLPEAQLDWCHRSGLKVLAGPLLSPDELLVPDWLYLWEDDEEGIHSYVAHYVREVVSRYQAKVHLWHCAARMNNGRCLGLSEESRLQLTATAIETLRELDRETSVIASIDQPWAEYMTRDATDLAPLYFADTLLRADIGLSGIGVELNFGYSHAGMSARDLVSVSRKLDHWSVLGVPLVAFVTAPSSGDDDPMCRVAPVEVIGSTGTTIDTTWQSDIAAQLIGLLLAKRNVQMIVWNQWADGHPHWYPHGGLVDADGNQKPARATLESLRREHLN